MSLLADPDAVFIGGDSSVLPNLSIEDKIEAWEFTVPHMPRTLHYGFTSMETFFTTSFFPDDQTIASKRENIRAVIKKGRHNVCQYKPSTPGPHLRFKLTDGSVYNYTIGHTFTAPQGLYLANLMFLGRFDEFKTLIYIYFESDNYEFDRWIYGQYTDNFR